MANTAYVLRKCESDVDSTLEAWAETPIVLGSEPLAEKAVEYLNTAALTLPGVKVKYDYVPRRIVENFDYFVTLGAPAVL